jgi:hypothetical protein
MVKPKDTRPLGKPRRIPVCNTSIRMRLEGGGWDCLVCLYLVQYRNNCRSHNTARETLFL